MRNRYKKYRILEHKIFLACLILLVFTLGILLLVGNNKVQLLSPHGLIASQEKQVIIFSILLMLFVLAPILGFAFYVAWKYRAGNEKKVKYSPLWDSHPVLGFVRFAIPVSLVAFLAVFVWKTSHRLDPFLPVEADAKPITIQVVSLNWKWLFIYPEQNIASVNFVEFPENTPINFELTSDAPMNSFWIPQLAGQMYSMAGMTTHLNLIANTTGEFPGTAAEINGKGFAGMKFTAKSVPSSDFEDWVNQVRLAPSVLLDSEYDQLAKDSENNPVVYYSSVKKDLFEQIIMKYMMPEGSADPSAMQHMHM